MGCQTNDKVGQFRLPIKSANKNLSSVVQKIVRFCRLIKSSDFVVQHRTCSILDDKIGQLLGYWLGDCLEREMNIYFSYLFCLLLCDSYVRSLDAEKNNASIILQFAFCCCVFVKLADIVRNVIR